jgi:hypothetical protein
MMSREGREEERSMRECGCQLKPSAAALVTISASRELTIKRVSNRKQNQANV